MISRSLKIFLFVFVIYGLSAITPKISNADTYSSNCIVNKIGNAPGSPPGCGAGTGSSGGTSNNAMGKLAIDLVNSITANCPNAIVSSDDLNCIKNMTIPASAVYPASVMSHILNSAAAYQDSNGVWYTGYFQCVGFVNAVTAGIYGTNGLQETNALSYASSYIGQNFSGYTFINSNGSQQILEGDMPIWSAAQAGNAVAGHIAMAVQVVDPVRGVFNVAQANWGPQGYVSFRQNVTIGEISGWLHKT